MKRVYVSGPYSKGDVAVNVRMAALAGLAIIKVGYAPFVPHLYHFMHMMDPQDYEVWMAVDAEWIKACHALLRLPGESSGADREVELALSLGIRVYCSLESLLMDLKEGMSYRRSGPANSPMEGRAVHLNTCEDESIWEGVED